MSRVRLNQGEGDGMTALPKDYKPIVGGRLALAIGHLLTEWSGAQGFLVRVLAELMIGRTLGDDDDTLHMSAIVGMEPRVLIGLIKSLAHARLIPSIHDGIGLELAAMEKSKDLRDFVSHCLWRIDERGREVGFQAKFVGRARLSQRIITVHEIETAIAGLHNASLSILGYLHASGYMKDYAPISGRPF